MIEIQLVMERDKLISAKELVIEYLKLDKEISDGTLHDAIDMAARYLKSVFKQTLTEEELA